jgi:hypothetical protein
MLFVTAAYHSKSHKHRDCLSFEWFEQGCMIIRDSGKYAYNSDKYRNYFLSARAHNTVEIEDFDIIKMRPYGSAIEKIQELGDGLFKISAGFSFPAISHHRALYFSPKRWLLVVDDLIFKRERLFTQWFHLDKEYQLRSIVDGAVCATNGNKNTVYLDNFNLDLSVRSHFGDEVVMQGFVSEKSYEYGPNLAIGFSGRCKQHRLLTLISLGEAERDDGVKYVNANFCNYAKAIPHPQAIPDKVLLNGVAHYESHDFKELALKEGRATYSTKWQGVPFNFYAEIRNVERLLIILPGATSRKMGCIDFQRHTWCSELPASCIVFSDPTIRSDNELTIGWFQGDKDHFAIDGLAEIVGTVTQKLGIPPNKVAFFGSSAGGFVALHVGNKFPDALVFAINPQIYLEKYSRSFYAKMLNTCYQECSEDVINNQYRNRMVVPLPEQKRTSPIFIMQNTDDSIHVERHLKPWLAKIDAKDWTAVSFERGMLLTPRKINIIYYSDPIAGHSPPGREDTLMALNFAFQCAGYV